MKKNMSILPMLALVLVISMTLVSAAFTNAVCATAETTYVTGKVTDQTNGNTIVPGADVEVMCGEASRDATTDANGIYTVQFTAEECDAGDTVTVTASSDSLSGEVQKTVTQVGDNTYGCQDGCCIRVIVNVACADVPLVPEFGLIVGGLTLVGAVTLFFVFRRK